CGGEQVAWEDCVQCEEGHLFCASCLARLTNERFFAAGKTDGVLQCMSSDGCSASFAENFLRRALDTKVYARYTEAVAAAVVKNAGLPDLVTCPHCQCMVELPANQEFYTCPTEGRAGGCGKKLCRRCGEEPHPGQRCEEVEKKAMTDSRRTVEEAMSEAVVRTCPKCKRKFTKDYGCNKMTCACGALICYICRQPIKGYQHFCQMPHGALASCGKCHLHTNSEEDDRMALAEVARQTKEKVEKESGAAVTTLDIDKLLK
ncbi:unnamed protein product, partial [Phaeothamnion confervicola]